MALLKSKIEDHNTFAHSVSYANLTLHMEEEDMEKEDRHTVLKWHFLQISRRKGKESMW